MLVSNCSQLGTNKQCTRLHTNSARPQPILKPIDKLCSGFGGLGVACWPLVPKIAGSNPAEAVGFLKGEKNPQHAFLRRGSKAVGPMSQMQKIPKCSVEVDI